MQKPNLWQGLHPCSFCGAPLRNGSRVRGSYWNPEVPLDAYEAINLLEVLKVVPSTGDWHGQLKSRCEATVAEYGTEFLKPNRNAEQMRKSIENNLYDA